MTIYSLLATLGGLFVISHIVTAVCNTVVTRSYHSAMVRMAEINTLSQMEVTYAPDVDDVDFSRFGSSDDDDGFLN